MDNFSSLPPSAQQAILYGPAATPPAGVRPNFDNPPHNNGLGIGVISACLAVSMLCVSVWIYSRVFCMKRIRIEDALGFAAFGFYAGLAWVGFSYASVVGFWVQQYNVQVITMSKVSYILYINAIVYLFGMMLLKIAIMLEWLHIFVPRRTLNKTFFWVSCTMITLNIMYYAAAIVSVQFYCIPREKIWDRWLPGQCLDRKSLDTSTGCFNVLFDIILLLMPQRVIWKLQLSTKRKLGISFVFSMGLLACICAAGRIYSVATLRYESNVSYDASAAYLWGIAEFTCALMVFCVPCFPMVVGDASRFAKYVSVKSRSGFSHRSAPKSSLPDPTSASDKSKTAFSRRNDYDALSDDAASQKVPLTTIRTARIRS